MIKDELEFEFPVGTLHNIQIKQKIVRNTNKFSYTQSYVSRYKFVYLR